MADEEPRDSKIIQFPSGGRDCGSDGAGRDPTIDEQIEAVELELRDVMGYARRTDTPPPSRPMAPRVTHRNAVRCPFCDEITWRNTPHCINCGGDLVAFAAEQAEQRRQARQAVVWSVAISSWVIALTCLYVAQRYSLSPSIHRALNAVGGGIMAINVAVLWYNSLDKRS